jgi:type I restriction enzyme R subunit
LLSTITPEKLKEKSFQRLIKEYLTNENGYTESANVNYDKYHALDKEMLFEFLESTQKKTMTKLKDIYGAEYKQKIIKRLDEELARRSMIDVLKHGIKDYGHQLKFTYFKPPTEYNVELNEKYQQNIFSVIEELNYYEDKRIDLVVFLNGLPIITMELKNQDTGQNYKNAINQYKHTRSLNHKLFRFKQRSIVNFAVDKDEIYMTTELNDEDTFFLPFNQGKGSGKSKRAGNPEVEGKLKTHYLWEKILQKDQLLEILQKFVFVDEEKEVDEQGNVHRDEKLIFPRFHQLDVITKILADAKANKAGHKYLVQHGAGSGKTYSITWLAHRLSSLHDENNNPIFNSVIVVTDRVSLDQQLQDTIYQIDHKLGVVAKIDKDSKQLADEINNDTNIIVSIIQKFPFILDKVTNTKDKNYAIVIDEAHSSTSGKQILALKESLSLEEAAELDRQAEMNTKDVEDKINDELTRVQSLDTISFFGFTATPKSSTLELFGTRTKDGRKEPFHVYSMRQAIEEGFILDVLENYMTYKTYYQVNKKIEDDPEFDKSRTSKEIARYVSLHPTNIQQKTEIMVEHFRDKTMHKINGEAKAMLVTSSRLHAVRYKLAFDKYIREKGYTDLQTLVAFSGTVKDAGQDYTEYKINDGIPESETAKEFDKDDYQILLVANKFQTGFDQPKLHTMFVDKRLRRVNAVQTLSRLNRTYKGIKEDTFVLDFANDGEDIRKAFEPYYEVTRLDSDNIDPNEMYTLRDEIMDSMIISIDDVEAFAEAYYNSDNKAEIIAAGDNALSHSEERIKELTEDEKLEFRGKIKRYINIYNLVLQVHPIKDTDLHKLNIYLRFLLKRIDIETPGKVDVSDKVFLEYFELEAREEDINLIDENTDLSIRVDGGGYHTEEKEYLSVIIERLNERFQTNFSESAKVALEQVSNKLKANENLKKRAKANGLEDFKFAVKNEFKDTVVESYTENTEFYGRILNDKEFKNKVLDLLLVDIYNSLNKEEN